MYKSLYSRYGQKGWQWNIIALEMQQKERMAQAVLTDNSFKPLQDEGKCWFIDTYCVQAAGRHGSSCFTRTEWISVLKSHWWFHSAWLPAHWHQPVHFPSHMNYSIPEVEPVLGEPGSVPQNMMTKKTTEQIISRKANDLQLWQEV